MKMVATVLKCEVEGDVEGLEDDVGRRICQVGIRSLWKVWSSLVEGLHSSGDPVIVENIFGLHSSQQ